MCGEILKMKMPFRQNWLNYNLYCYKTGLNPCDYKIFKNWIEKGVCIKND